MPVNEYMGTYSQKFLLEQVCNIMSHKIHIFGHSNNQIYISYVYLVFIQFLKTVQSLKGEMDPTLFKGQGMEAESASDQ